MGHHREYGDTIRPELHRHISELERHAEEVLLAVKDLYAETMALDAAQRGILSPDQAAAVRDVMRTFGDECFRSISFVRGVVDSYRGRLCDAYQEQ